MLTVIIIALLAFVAIPGGISGVVCGIIGGVFKKIDGRVLFVIWIVLTVIGIIVYYNVGKGASYSSTSSYKSSYTAGSSYSKSKSGYNSSNGRSSSSGAKYVGVSGNSSSYKSIKDDPYDTYWYDDADDFAADWAGEFDSYDDAYDYWEDMH